MKIPATSAAAIGRIARRVRRAQGISQQDLADIVQTSHVTLRHLEQGRGTVQWGLVLAVLDELGIELTLDVPDALAEQIDSAPPDRRGRT